MLPPLHTRPYTLPSWEACAQKMVNSSRLQQPILSPSLAPWLHQAGPPAPATYLSVPPSLATLALHATPLRP